MAELNEQVGLDISQALSEADDLAVRIGDSIESAIATAFESFGTLGASAAEEVGSAIADAIANAVTEAPEVAIAADVSEIAPEIEAAVADVAPVVPVSADTAPAEESVRDLVDVAESTNAEITVTADTSGAQDSLDELRASSDDAGESVSGTAVATGALGSASSLADGSVQALSNTAANLASKGGAVGVGVGVAVGTLGAFTASAINSLGATERLDSAFGSFADRVNTIHVGDLNIELGDLAIKTGSSGSNMRNAAVDALHLGESYGKTKSESADFSAEILALTARAVALDPALGDTGEAAGRLMGALASGREKALIPFQLGLSKAAIDARAMQIAVADGRDTITAADRAFAGAALAVERLGSHLHDDIEEGSKNPILQARSLTKEFTSFTTELAKPLVTPTLDALRSSLPIVQATLEPVGQLAAQVIPVIATALQAATPVIIGVGDALQFVLGKLNEIPGGSAIATGALVGLVNPLAGLAVGGFALAPTLGRGLADYIEILDVGLKVGTDFDKEMSDIEKSTRAVADANNEDLVPSFRALMRQVDDANTTAINPAAIKLEAFRKVAEASPEVAIRLRDAIGGTATEVRGYNLVLNNVLGAQRDDRAAKQEAAVANQELATSYQTPTEAAIAFVSALQAEQKILAELENELLGVPGAVINYEQSQRDLTKAQEDYNAAVGIFGPESKEAADAALRLDSANLAVARSVLNLNAEQEKLLQTLHDNPAAIDAERAHLVDLQNQFPEAAAQIQPLIDRLDEAARARQGKIDIDVQSALDHIAEVVRAVNSAASLNLLGQAGFDIPDRPSAELPSNFQDYLDEQRRIAEGAAYVASLQGRAAGGPVEAGRSYLVNEDTPNSEIFTPWASGMIQPQIRVPLYAGAPAPPVQHIDNSQHVTNNVPPSYRSPERLALFTLKRLRAEGHLAGK